MNTINFPNVFEREHKVYRVTRFLEKIKRRGRRFFSQEFPWARLEPKAGLFSLLKSFGEE
jgi:hypothetical protein